MPATTNYRSTEKRPHRAVTVALLALLGIHLLTMFLWIAPGNPLKNMVYEPLKSYALPLFQQSWSLFAPNPVSSALYLEVRAVPKDLSETEWVEASMTELEGVHHNVFPATATMTSTRLVDKAWNSFKKIDQSEQEILSWNYHHNAWERLGKRFEKTAESQVSSSLVYDEALTAYATQFLLANDLIEEGQHVQYRFVSIAVPRFEQRREEDNKTSVTFTSGRRPQTVLQGQDAEGFARGLGNFR